MSLKREARENEQADKISSHHHQNQHYSEVVSLLLKEETKL